MNLIILWGVFLMAQIIKFISREELEAKKLERFQKEWEEFLEFEKKCLNLNEEE